MNDLGWRRPLGVPSALGSDDPVKVADAADVATLPAVRACRLCGMALCLTCERVICSCEDSTGAFCTCVLPSSVITDQPASGGKSSARLAVVPDESSQCCRACGAWVDREHGGLNAEGRCLDCRSTWSEQEIDDDDL